MLDFPVAEATGDCTSSFCQSSQQRNPASGSVSEACSIFFFTRNLAATDWQTLTFLGTWPAADADVQYLLVRRVGVEGYPVRQAGAGGGRLLAAAAAGHLPGDRPARRIVPLQGYLSRPAPARRPTGRLARAVAQKHLPNVEA